MYNSSREAIRKISRDDEADSIEEEESDEEDELPCKVFWFFMKLKFDFS